MLSAWLYLPPQFRTISPLAELHYRYGIYKNAFVSWCRSDSIVSLVLHINTGLRVWQYNISSCSVPVEGQSGSVEGARACPGGDSAVRSRQTSVAVVSSHGRVVTGRRGKNSVFFCN